MASLIVRVHVDIFNDHMSQQYVFTQKEINVRQRRWLELLKNYNMSIIYSLGKENVVFDALRKLSMGSIAHVDEKMTELSKYVHRVTRMGVRLMDSIQGEIFLTKEDESSLVSKVKGKLDQDLILLNLKVIVHKQRIFSFDQGEMV